MKKRLISTILCIAMCAGLVAGCGAKEEKKEEKKGCKGNRREGVDSCDCRKLFPCHLYR